MATSAEMLTFLNTHLDPDLAHILDTSEIPLLKVATRLHTWVRSKTPKGRERLAVATLGPKGKTIATVSHRGGADRSGHCC